MTGSIGPSVMYSAETWCFAESSVKVMLGYKGVLAAIEDDVAAREALPPEKKQSAYSIVMMHVKGDERPSLEINRTAKALYDALHNKYAQRSQAAQAILLKEYTSFVMGFDETLLTYANRFKNLCIRMRAAGMHYTEAQNVTTVLNGLPDSSYSVFKTIVTEVGVETVDDLERRMINESLRRAESAKQASANAVATGNAGGRGNGSGFGGGRGHGGGHGGGSGSGGGKYNPHKNLDCRYCNKRGHIERNCRKKERDEQERSRVQQVPQAQAAQAAQPQPPQQRQGQAPGQRRHLVAANMVAPVQTAQDEWLFDTGAEEHVTGDIGALVDMIPVGKEVEFKSPLSSAVAAKLKGRVTLGADGFGDDVTVSAYLVPGFELNLLSEKALKRDFGSVSTVLCGDGSYIEIQGAPALKLHYRQGMYYVRSRQLIAESPAVAEEVPAAAQPPAEPRAHLSLGPSSVPSVGPGASPTAGRGVSAGADPGSPLQRERQAMLGKIDEAQRNREGQRSPPRWFVEEVCKKVVREMAAERAREKADEDDGDRARLRAKLEKRRAEREEKATAFRRVMFPRLSSCRGLSQARTRVSSAHRVLGHPSLSTMRAMAQHSMVEGLGYTVADVDAAKGMVCEPCALGKQSQQPHVSSGHVSTKPLQLVHMDLCGPMPVKAVDGEGRYFATFYDDYSKYSEVRLLPSKDMVGELVEEVLKSWETRTGCKLLSVRTDRGTEYVNEYMRGVFRSMGALHGTSAPYSPEQNGAAERLNRTLLDRARVMMAAVEDCPQSLWGEAVKTASHQRNMSATAGSTLTPWERFTGEKPDVSHMREFGRTAYVMIPKAQRKKLDAVAVTGMMVGYEPGAWRIWVPSKHRVMSSKDVVFGELEMDMPGLVDSDDDSDWEPVSEEEEEKMSNPDSPVSESGSDGDPVGGEPGGAPADADGVEPGQAADDADLPISQRKAKRARAGVPPLRYTGAVGADGLGVKIPSTYAEAMTSSQAQSWRAAMEEEIASLLEKRMWSLVPKPAAARALGVKWVFSVKQDKHGVLERFKARLVVKGFMQREGVDYKEVFAPVSRHATLRAFLAMVAAGDMELHQLDVKTAFLNGDLEEEIYVEQPPGFESGGPSVVCRLHKSLYGLRQAPRTWHKKLHDQLVSMGFVPSMADPSLYVRDVDGVPVYVLVYVDDLLIAAYDGAQVQEVKEEILRAFDSRDMGEADLFLGLAIQRDRESRTLTVSQWRMIEEVVADYGMSSARPKSVPMSPGTHLVKAGVEERLDAELYPYSALVGSLLYIAGCTRPDISQAVGVLTRHMSAPGKEHWKAGKEVVRYLAGTADYGLVFGGDRVGEGLLGYSDADHAGCVDTRRSTSGVVFLLHGAAVSWASKFQRTVAVSTMEAEYVAASEAAKEALWLRQLLSDLGYALNPTQMKCDSQCALKVVKNPVITERSKHIAVRYHSVREFVASGAITMIDCRTSEMVADCLTKPLPFESFRKHREAMGVRKV
ncbi:hypothetical protein PLESTB_000600200 [Pleodorina starrii]|uniref:Uncharacterized protein n=1 Tax=Pleodorina starrii TaxID=330485 RepID=A0A9W6F1E7_9CHLO|nr:hypothetical protein PLESTM_002035200 [Pleodorina starrii]GLC52245.1 hypothetical protein PLESTB_000600200 [Pleodorina starrii]